ncbi:MAG: hypothetical protein AAF195_01265 [Pseudomonadota bacterium]
MDFDGDAVMETDDNPNFANIINTLQVIRARKIAQNPDAREEIEENFSIPILELESNQKAGKKSEVDLDKCFLSDDDLPEILKAIIADGNINVLLIDNNKITDEGARIIANFLEKSNIDDLSLSESGITDKGLKEIYNASLKNNTLTTFTFEPKNRKITPEESEVLELILKQTAKNYADKLIDGLENMNIRYTGDDDITEPEQQLPPPKRARQDPVIGRP